MLLFTAWSPEIDKRACLAILVEEKWRKARWSPGPGWRHPPQQQLGEPQTFGSPESLGLSPQVCLSSTKSMAWNLNGRRDANPQSH